jgi:hypothetical protein
MLEVFYFHEETRAVDFSAELFASQDSGRTTAAAAEQPRITLMSLERIAFITFASANVTVKAPIEPERGAFGNAIILCSRQVAP